MGLLKLYGRIKRHERTYNSRLKRKGRKFGFNSRGMKRHSYYSDSVGGGR